MYSSNYLWYQMVYTCILSFEVDRYIELIEKKQHKTTILTQDLVMNI